MHWLSFAQTNGVLLIKTFVTLTSKKTKISQKC